MTVKKQLVRNKLDLINILVYQYRKLDEELFVGSIGKHLEKK